MCVRVQVCVRVGVCVCACVCTCMRAGVSAVCMHAHVCAREACGRLEPCLETHCKTLLSADKTGNLFVWLGDKGGREMHLQCGVWELYTDSCMRMPYH